MADKDLPVLRKSASFQKLSPAHQDVLVDYCRNGKPDKAETRERDSAMWCADLLALDEAVRQTLLGKIKEDSRRFVRLYSLTGTASWEKPRLDGKEATGADVSLCRRRMVQVISLLVDRQLTASSGRATLLENTIEWFIFGGLRLEFGKSPAEGVLGQYITEGHRLLLCHDSLLKIGPDSIGDPRETLRKIAHEVNHACRRKEAIDSDGAHMVDELFAYVTELLAAGQTVTRKQMAETFQTLSGPPYNLRKVINSQAGKDYQERIQYKEYDANNTLLVYPLPSPGTESQGWNHTNAVPGLA